MAADLTLRLHQFSTLRHSLWYLRRQYGILSSTSVLMSTRSSSTNASQRMQDGNSNQAPQGDHVTAAALEKGSTMYFNNRNPRSLELLGVAEKPKGFVTKSHREDYYHRLMLEISSRHVSAYVNHNSGTKVVEASTREFCISKHLYKTSDVAAAFNIGRVMASRCKESGLYRVMWEHKWDRNHKKVVAFIKGVRHEGLILNEPRPRKTLPPAGTLPGH